jgi:aryl-alcohol dehydrogenase-like predicted oxidoreductase
MATEAPMARRPFGRTGMSVSVLGFGAWAIGGQAYGAVDRGEALRALARAESLGCGLVDTAAVYGDSEAILGEFLRGRREHWFVSTKYSGQPEGLRATLDAQLRRLGTDRVEFYMVHWMPGRGEDLLLEELAAVRREGKARAVGVSLKTANDIDRAISLGLDGFMLRAGLLDPDPLLAKREVIAKAGIGVLVRSALAEGFLAGKFRADHVFDDPGDQRREWPRERIAATVAKVERFRFLERAGRSLAQAAAAWPLSLPEVSCVVLGVRSVLQAEMNFGAGAGDPLPSPDLDRIADLQRELGLRQKPRPLWRRVLDRLRR